jgi:acid stress-induced BolA-like protein IbaG/YrbA
MSDMKSTAGRTWNPALRRRLIWLMLHVDGDARRVRVSGEFCSIQMIVVTNQMRAQGRV